MNRRDLLPLLAALAAAPLPAAGPLAGRALAAPARPDSFSAEELVDSGHRFFGSVSRGLALTVEEAVRRWGEPDAYILGQEGSGAVFGGLTYGEGRLHRRRSADERIFWQGPSLGFDLGADGSRTMMLVYNLRSRDDLYRRFVELEGSAFVVAGFGLTAATADDVVLVPIRAGIGLRLGVKLGYMKFTDAPTWNPF